MFAQLHIFAVYDNGSEGSQSIMSFPPCAGISGVHLRQRGPHRLLFGSGWSGGTIAGACAVLLAYRWCINQWRLLNSILSIVEVDVYRWWLELAILKMSFMILNWARSLSAKGLNPEHMIYSDLEPWGYREIMKSYIATTSLTLRKNFHWQSAQTWMLRGCESWTKTGN